MRQTLSVPENIQAKIQWNKLTVVDGFIIIGSLAVGYFMKGLVYPFLQLPFVLFVVLATTFYLWPCPDSPNKKIYEMTLMVFRKDSRTYKAQEPVNYSTRQQEDQNGI
ncbi:MULTISPECIES: DUF5592 family protein [Bacillaceae]|uniref:PrgI family protein n=1 Tax=Bacillus velezensis TaxID=492670 RepID=A0ABC8DEV9_BACVE|nr:MULTISPECIES: DUF5592 family protein [Bacillaceae]AVI31003.1 hypothetical protein C3Z10_21645 [Bacillus velezensis]AWX74637.1 hypothetical protein BVDSYZ_21575 [Bacillus velezensis]MBR7817975.1 hypothetical protein [Bacillus sp. CCNWLCWHY013]MDJ0479966.1 DUF5592 family protein [Bacillus amyloliquefaciens]MDK2561750.1 DUF5592 family protein [Bacillus amyloliquefaciens]